MENERGLYQKALEGDEGCIQQMRQHVERIKQEQATLERQLARVQEGDLTEAELAHAQYQLEIDPYGDLLPTEWTSPPVSVDAPVESGGSAGEPEIPFVPGNFGGLGGGGGHDVDN